MTIYIYIYIYMRLFRMVTDQTKCSRLEQRFVIKFLMVDQRKPCDIYSIICDVYGKVCLSEKKCFKWSKLFKVGRNSIQKEDRPSRPTVASTPEMVESFNALVLFDRRVTIDDIYEQMGISVGTAQN